MQLGARTARNPIGLVATALAIAIFAIDTLSPREMAVAVLYVLVVLMAAGFLPHRGVLAVSAACIAATLFSYLWHHGFTHLGTPFARCVMSLFAIGVTTALVVRAQIASLVLSEQARLLDLTHDTVFVRDLNDVITYWNRAAEQLYGWTREEAVGRVSRELMRTSFPIPLEAITAELLRTGRWEGELLHTLRDGRQVVLASRWSLELDERQRPLSILETNTDITERNRTQEALHRSQAELAHVTRVTTLGELTASIAHEVNQPLAAIVTNGEACLRWLDREVPQLDEARSAVERVIGDGRRASEVIRRLRALSKKTEVQRAPLNVNDVIDEAILLVQHEVLQHRVRLQLELASELPPVLGDRVQLQQVIINLLVNGIQAMATVADRLRELRIESQRYENDEVLVAVHDSGVGIDPESASRLFTAFYSTRPNGMGMGLSICRSIVEAHGGRVWVASDGASGATFRFTLPVASHTNV
jgi:PAS domain S-box-containing protein